MSVITAVRVTGAEMSPWSIKQLLKSRARWSVRSKFSSAKSVMATRAMVTVAVSSATGNKFSEIRTGGQRW